ncbi:MAG: hemolysin family protein [Gammaproteobacteria bacterium]|nr:hemolysin family protein [Gammaproteobacteria bacterium]
MDTLITLWHDLPLSAVEIEIIIRSIIQVLLLAGAVVFSGSETALFSLSRIDLQRLRQTRTQRSESIHAMLDEPRRLIISILCGNELVNIASAVNMAGIMLLLFDRENIGWINILVTVPLLLLVGEVTPKTIAVSFPVKFSTRLTARILPRWIVFITPLREAVRFVADRITTFVVGEAVDRENLLKRDELRTLLEEGEQTGIIEATERVLIDNLLEASETDISRIMTPSIRIRFLDAALPVAELIEKFRQYAHPRVPVYEGHWDNVIGFIHSEDVLRIIKGGGDLAQTTLDALLKPAHFVPPTKKIDEMFDYFQAHNTRAAIILGEYGEVHGLVTMKDVLTFIFGEISGRMAGQEYYEEEDENSYIVPGDMRLTDFNNLTNFDIDDPVMTTIGGVAFRLFDSLPRKNQSLVHEGFEFIALELTGLRISKLMVRRIVVSDRPAEKAMSVEEEQVETVAENEQPEAKSDADESIPENAADKEAAGELESTESTESTRGVKHGPVD